MNKNTAIDYSRRITQSSPTGLVVITYELMNLHLRDAEDAMALITDAGELQSASTAEREIAFHASMKKARTLLGELISSLNLQYALSGELLRIYLYLNRELQLADLRKDVTLLPRLRGIIASLHDAFEEVAKSDVSGPVMENTQKVYAGMTYSKGSLNEDLVGDPNRGFKI